LLDSRPRRPNLRLALAQFLQIIGEATSRVSRELQAQHPEIPSAAIIGMRHEVVRDYLGSARA